MKKIIIPLIALALAACQSTATSSNSEYIPNVSSTFIDKVPTIYRPYINGDYKTAIKLASDISPRNFSDRATIDAFKGISYFKLSDYDMALPLLEKSAELPPYFLPSNSYLDSVKALTLIYMKRKNEEKTSYYAKKLAQHSRKLPLEAIEELITEQTKVTQKKFSGALFTIPPNDPEGSRFTAGYVIMKFDITENGRVANIRVEESVPNGLYTNESIKAFKQWIYYPIAAKDQTIRLDFYTRPTKK